MADEASGFRIHQHDSLNKAEDGCWGEDPIPAFYPSLVFVPYLASSCYLIRTCCDCRWIHCTLVLQKRVNFEVLFPREKRRRDQLCKDPTQGPNDQDHYRVYWPQTLHSLLRLNHPFCVENGFSYPVSCNVYCPATESFRERCAPARQSLGSVIASKGWEDSLIYVARFIECGQLSLCCSLSLYQCEVKEVIQEHVGFLESIGSILYDKGPLTNLVS